jgi:hypothetical protein
MRTTLEIDDDVLLAAKELAAVDGRTAGQVVSALARKGLEVRSPVRRSRNGVPLLPRRTSGAARPTMTLVNELKD